MTTIAKVEHQVEIDYLVAKWKHSELALFPQAIEHGLTVPDPYSKDVVCPITIAGHPFDWGKASFVTPFTPAEVAGSEAGAGVGWLLVGLRPERPPFVMSPGKPPEMRADMILDITIATPSGRGGALSKSYTGALAMLHRYVTFRPQTAGIDLIRNYQLPPEQPTPDGDDGTWRFDQVAIQLSRMYRVAGAGTQ